MQTSKIKSPSGLLLFASLIASIGVHTYLFNEYVKAKYTMEAGSSMCSLSDYFNCSGSVSSPFSDLFGTPLSIFGIIVQLVILFFSLKALLFSSSSEKTSTSSHIALTLARFSVLVSITMAGISVLIVKSLCPFCTAAYVLSFITLFCAQRLMKPLTEPWNASATKGVLVAFVFVGLAGFASGFVTLHKYKNSELQQMLTLVFDNWKNQPAQEVVPVAPVKIGPDTAKMKIVEFADFLCSHCKNAFPKLHEFIKTNPDVQLQFQTWPLDGCKMAGTEPGLRCQLGIANYCANLQGQGEKSAEYLFERQEQLFETTDIKKEMSDLATQVGLNAETFTACLKDPQSLEMVKKQVEVGVALKVEGTPAFFINGKAYRGPPEPTLLKKVYDSL